MSDLQVLTPISADVAGHAVSLSGEGLTKPRGQTARPLISARSDEEAARFFLDQKAKTPRTREAYEREVHRFLLWCRRQTEPRFDFLSGNDLERYQQELASGSVPTPAEIKRIATGKASAEDVLNGKGRRAIGPGSVNYAMGILRSMFDYLLALRYLTGNAFVAVEDMKVLDRGQQVERYLDAASWSDLKRTLEEFPRSNGRQIAQYNQRRWTLALAVLAGLRRSEMASGCMGQFIEIESRWWLVVIGKGQKQRKVPASPILMEELAAYRGWLREFTSNEQIGPEPKAGDTESQLPLIVRLDKKVGAVSPKRVWAIVHLVVEKTAARLEMEGQAVRAAFFRNVSTHWLRHTGVSAVANRVDVQTAQKYARHAHVQTTMGYVHVEDGRMHDAVSAAQEAAGLFDSAPPRG